MNAQRRKEIQKQLDIADGLQNDLDALREEEQECYDNMPESFQSGEKGERAQSAIDGLEGAINAAQEAVDYLNEAMEA